MLKKELPDDSQLMGRRHLAAFEFGDPVFQPSHALYQLVRMAKPDVHWTSPLIKFPEQFSSGIANPFGQCIGNLPNSLGEILRCFFSDLPDCVGKILFRYWLAVHTQLDTTK